MDNSYDTLMKKSFLPYRMGYLTDWMIEKAKEELNETDENRAQAIAELRRLIAKERNLDVWTDDAFLLQFLRARKFEPERTMDLIRNLFTMLKDYPDIYPKQQDTEIVNSLFETNAGGPYPYRHKDGGAIFFLKNANWDPEKVSPQLAVSSLTGMILSLTVDPATQVCGVHLVLDAELKMSHLRVISLRYIKLCSKLFRNTLPIKFNGIHVVNESAIFRYIFNILRIFLTEKIRKRIYFHGSDFKELHKYIPKEILPAEYGGDNINYSPSEFCKKELSEFVEKYSRMLGKGYF